MEDEVLYVVKIKWPSSNSGVDLPASDDKDDDDDGDDIVSILGRAPKTR